MNTPAYPPSLAGADRAAVSSPPSGRNPARTGDRAQSVSLNSPAGFGWPGLFAEKNGLERDTATSP